MKIKQVCLFAALCGLLCLVPHSPARANGASTLGQANALEIPAVPREFRGVWVVSVGNGNWPSRCDLTADQQKAELIAILDRAVQLKLNAIVLQIRPVSDALYNSPKEPWSAFLTGQLGQPPNPLYDPLAFAVEEAHKRGLELHAWYNPFRATLTVKNGPVPLNHVTQTHPELVRQYGKDLWLDPGEPGSTNYVLSVVQDIVRRYDIDGIHIDDYFYPYVIKDANKNNVDFPDDATYQNYVQGGGTLTRHDWRRDNINNFVRRFYEMVKAEKPWVKVGISPFGIWRPKNPPSVEGMDAYEEIYADSKLWLNKGWADYFAPQLYWAIAAPKQSYPDLLKWWTEQNTQHRNLWVGNYTGRLSFTDPKTSFKLEEIPAQVQATRNQPGATGNIHFDMDVLMKNQDLANLLMQGVYAQPALVPASPWLDSVPPAQPKLNLTKTTNGTSLNWQAGNEEPVWQWVLQTHRNGAWTTEILPTQTLNRSWPSDANKSDMIAVSAVDRCGNQSIPAIVRLNE
ncbi:MAG: family 10 glycosylhydrolase [Abitibacteriaceae bacterium]|nr:family 10 glycosylhydrolase [Abditibacteriaceae bacterium]